MILMLDKQNNPAVVFPVQMKSREKWRVNILCTLCEHWGFNWLHKHKVIMVSLQLNSFKFDEK